MTHPELEGLVRETTLLHATDLALRDPMGFWRAPHAFSSAYSTTPDGWIRAATDACQNRKLSATHVFLLALEHPARHKLPADATVVNVDASAVVISSPMPTKAWRQPPERNPAFWGIQFPLAEALAGRPPAAYGLHEEIPVALVELPHGRHLAVAGHKPQP